jgi:hypothetical protein
MASNPVDLALNLEPPAPIDEVRANRIVRNAIHQLISRHVFFGSLIAQMKVVTGAAAAKKVPTACVYVISGGDIGMAVNPYWFDTLTPPQRVGVLIHEIEHVIRMHLIRMRNFSNKRRFNIAADMALNQNIPAENLWEEPAPILPNSIPELDLPYNQTSEFYYKALSPEDEEDGEEPTAQGFAAGALIHTKTGPKPVEQIQIGDELITWNFNTRRRFHRAVRQIQKSDNVEVSAVHGAGGALQFSCSELQPFAGTEQGKRVNAPAIVFSSKSPGMKAPDGTVYQRLTHALCFDPGSGGLKPGPIDYVPSIKTKATVYKLMVDGYEKNFFVGPQGVLTARITVMGRPGDGPQPPPRPPRPPGDQEERFLWKAGDEAVINEGPDRGKRAVVTWAGPPDADGSQELEWELKDSSASLGVTTPPDQGADAVRRLLEAMKKKGGR